jgi:putative DNA primase/helicase
MVSAAEASEHDRLKEGLVKHMTGGDTLSASFKGQPVFEFKPVLALWLATNHVPRMPADDSGIWRRIHKIPFENEITEELKAAARAPETRPAILAWAVAGWLAEGPEGRPEPAEVRDRRHRRPAEAHGHPAPVLR